MECRRRCGRRRLRARISLFFSARVRVRGRNASVAHDHVGWCGAALQTHAKERARQSIVHRIWRQIYTATIYTEHRYVHMYILSTWYYCTLNSRHPSRLRLGSKTHSFIVCAAHTNKYHIAGRLRVFYIACSNIYIHILVRQRARVVYIAEARSVKPAYKMCIRCIEHTHYNVFFRRLSAPFCGTLKNTSKKS